MKHVSLFSTCNTASHSSNTLKIWLDNAMSWRIIKINVFECKRLVRKI